MAYGGVTGYTAGIVDGSIKNAREFLMLCIRAFMVCVEQKEDSLSARLVTEFKPDEYYFKSYQEAQEDLECLEHMTFDEVKAYYIEEQRKSIEHDKYYYEKMVDEYTKYRRILTEVENWAPPTKDHDTIKEFAIKQITMCMPTEEEIEDRRRKSNRSLNVSDNDVMEWYNVILECARRHVKVRRETLDEKIKNAQDKTEFMQRFIDSLPE